MIKGAGPLPLESQEEYKINRILDNEDVGETLLNGYKTRSRFMWVMLRTKF